MNTEAITKEFQDVLERCTKVAVCGRHFILVDKLQKWLRTTLDPEGTTHADLLLHVAFGSRKLPGPPVDSNALLAGDSCCLLIFCILHQIGSVKALPFFSRSGNVDRLLPLRPDSVRVTFQAACKDDRELQAKSSSLIGEFLKRQFRYSPAKFNLHQGADWDDEDAVVPICEKNSINKKGGTAELWQIAVPEEFVGHTLRYISSGSRFNVNAGKDTEPEWYQFALKTFRAVNYHLYKNEMDALRGLKDHEGMVRWLADYKKTETPGAVGGHAIAEPSDQRSENATYNILLEYGEMDLDNYFYEKEPPVQPSDIKGFWTSVFAVADALKGIHNLRVKDAGITMEFHGWHTDIKPDNILYVEERVKTTTSPTVPNTSEPIRREKAFKLADPGFAKFNRKSQEKSQEVPKQVLEGGTETYGAPEYPGRSDFPVSQAIDIWSLGCVFSLAATWLSLGLRGIYQFQAMRELVHEQRAQAASQNQATKDSHGDHFHDGRQVLEDVIGWHELLRTSLRRTDSITSQVLDLVDKRMLLGSPEQRITATELCSELSSILQTTPDKDVTRMPSAIRSVIEEYAFTRDIRRSSSFERRLRTTYGQSFWPDQSSPWQKKDSLGNDYPDRNLVSSPNPSPGNTPPRNVTAHQRVPTELNIPITSSLSQRRESKKTHQPMNVFQAREALERRKKPFNFFRNHHTKKEEFSHGLLHSYFQGTRDIMFLVDNAESMRDHWYEAKFVLGVLVEMAKGLDEDGMDLRFTTGTTKLEGKDSSNKFVASMKQAYPTKGARTDPRLSLGNILDTYANKLRTKEKFPNNKVKDLVLIVLTDGIWAGMQDKYAIATQLKNISKKVDYSIKQRPFSVQFIQFGYDESASQVFRYLDDYFDNGDIPDFIDTVHSKGDVKKMLLGSFVEDYDRAESDDHNSFDSPPPDHSTMSPRAYQSPDGREVQHELSNGANLPILERPIQDHRSFS